MWISTVVLLTRTMPNSVVEGLSCDEGGVRASGFQLAFIRLSGVWRRAGLVMPSMAVIRADCPETIFGFEQPRLTGFFCPTFYNHPKCLQSTTPFLASANPSTPQETSQLCSLRSQQLQTSPAFTKLFAFQIKLII
jgi:hypothetical protein